MMQLGLPLNEVNHLQRWEEICPLGRKGVKKKKKKEKEERGKGKKKELVLGK